MAEKEYIEREAAIDALTERNLVVHMDSVNDGLVASCHRSAQRIIANLPAADAIEELSSQLDDFKRLCLPLKENRLYKYSDGSFVEVFLILPSEPPKEE